MVFARDPHDSAGSYQMLVPQVSAALTEQKADNFLQISHAILDAIRGDYDGDKVRPLNQLVLDENEFAAARSGARSEEHTSELQSLMRISYAVFCLKKKTKAGFTPYEAYIIYQS